MSVMGCIVTNFDDLRGHVSDMTDVKGKIRSFPNPL